MSLLSKIKKSISKSSEISLDASDPKFWLSTGNYLVNKIMSGKFMTGIPQGRVTCYSGPSSSGKSFMLGNAIRQARAEGYVTIVIDSEHALDTDYLNRIGIDTDNEDGFLYISVSTLEGATKALQEIITMIREETAKNPEQKYLIVVDSLDWLLTNSARDTYEKKGELNNDQGLEAKKHKQFVKHISQDIKYLPICFILTKQVYAVQEEYAVPRYKMSDAVFYAFSQLFLFTKLLDKNKETKTFTGIRLKVFGWKNRFSQPYQQCEIQVPYDSGLDPYSGLLDFAVASGVVERNGAWYTIDGEKFQSTKWDNVKEKILAKLIEQEDNLEVNMQIEGIEEGHEDVTPVIKPAARQLAERLNKEIDDGDD